MRYSTILKELESIKRSRSLEEVIEKIDALIEKLSVYVQKEKKSEQAAELLEWYVNLWNGRPPESFGSVRWQEKLVGILNKLIALYEEKGLTIENLKQDYQNFKNNFRDMNRFYRENSITYFRSILPHLKGSGWTSP